MIMRITIPGVEISEKAATALGWRRAGGKSLADVRDELADRLREELDHVLAGAEREYAHRHMDEARDLFAAAVDAARDAGVDIEELVGPLDGAHHV